MIDVHKFNQTTINHIVFLIHYSHSPTQFNRNKLGWIQSHQQDWSSVTEFSFNYIIHYLRFTGTCYKNNLFNNPFIMVHNFCTRSRFPQNTQSILIDAGIGYWVCGVDQCHTQNKNSILKKNKLRSPNSARFVYICTFVHPK